MKKLKYLAYVIAATFVLSSCNDAIDIVQDGELTEQVALQKVSDLRSFLNGNIYTSFDTTNEIQLTSAFTDEVGITPGNSGWFYAEHRYILNTTTAEVAGIWANSYLTINRVNRLLRAAEQIIPSSNDEEVEYNSILAEARTMRALAYLRLESYFTTDMTDDNALGVIWVEGVPEINAQLPRVSNGEIYSKIEADLDFAEQNLQAGNSYYFVTPNLINAIRARMYSYRENYTLAKQYAQAVISNSVGLTPATPIPASPGSDSFNSSFYSAATANPYRKIWADADQGEIIFALSRPSTGSWGNISSLFTTTNTTDIDGSPLLDMGRNLFNLMDPNYDVRRWAFIDPTSKVSETYDTDPDYRYTDVLVIDKYPGKGSTPLRNDLKVFRLSEMYLILAEAAVTEHNLDVAAANVKMVRDARRFAGTAPSLSYSSDQEAYRDILKERRVEFCFEGFRYVDLRRLGEKAGVSIDRNHTDDIIDAPLTLSITDYRWTLPIPQVEILGNPSIAQNPGY